MSSSALQEHLRRVGEHLILFPHQAQACLRHVGGVEQQMKGVNYVEPVEFSLRRYSLEALSPPLALTAAFWPHLPTLAVYFIIMIDKVVKVPVML